MKDLIMTNDARSIDMKYMVRCPHCQKSVKIKIKTEMMMIVNDEKIYFSDGSKVKIENNQAIRIIG
jgi:hypothetical protein